MPILNRFNNSNKTLIKDSPPWGRDKIYFQFLSFKRKKLATSFCLKALKLLLIIKSTQPVLDEKPF